MTLATPELVERVRRQIADGGSFGQIAVALGLSKGRVAGLIRRHLQAQWDARPLRVLRAKPSPPPLSLATREGCMWPMNDGRPWRFCNDARQPGRVYCARHQRLGTQHRSYTEAAE